jgi:hypothetical protein
VVEEYESMAFVSTVVEKEKRKKEHQSEHGSLSPLLGRNL